VEKLRSVNLANRGVLFVVFPATPAHKEWQMKLSRISGSLRRLSEETFSFLDKIPGIIYFGLA
jgi:hypothetical protein